MGSRFESNLKRKKDRYRPFEGSPGPGAYKLPSTIKQTKHIPGAKQGTKFGTASKFENKDFMTPGPNRYRPSKFTEAVSAYSFP